MPSQGDSPIAWVVTEGLIGLQNQALGLAQALGLTYTLITIQKPQGLSRFFQKPSYGLTPPWPDVLITCGRQSVPVSLYVRRASQGRTFTVHIQNPLINPAHFDVVVAPQHDHVSGKNVVVTQGAIHHVTMEKLNEAAQHFRPLLSSLPRPIITVLVGGKNRHQAFSPSSVKDFSQKVLTAASQLNASLAVTFSRRTGADNEAFLKKELMKVPSYIWDNSGENPYFGLLSLSEAIVVTSDSISMISESCSTGKPVYIYELPHAGPRHKELVKSLMITGNARPFLGPIELWKNTALNETAKAAEFIHRLYQLQISKRAIKLSP